MEPHITNYHECDNMPVITIEASRTLDKETKKKLIEDVSKSVAESYGFPIQSIDVIIRENSPDNIGDGGVQVSSNK